MVNKKPSSQKLQSSTIASVLPNFWYVFQMQFGNMSLFQEQIKINDMLYGAC